MFSLKDMWSRPSYSRSGTRHRPDIWPSFGTIVVVIILLVFLSGFAWALIEFIKEKIG